MNSFSPAEIVANYSSAGKKKAEGATTKLILMAILAGMIIGFGGAVSNTAVHAIDNVSLAKVISGLIFPFGLGIIMLMGMELFTGNVMLSITVLNKQTKLKNMFRNWLIVYFGNFAGAASIALGTAFFGQMNYSNGGLALYTMQLGIDKLSMPFQNAFISGILCNLLVCSAVLCFYAAKDTAGQIMGAYLAVAFFVIAGFEHCVANMYYGSSAIFASMKYADLALSSGLDTSVLTWSNLLLKNLVPVTLGNITGGSIIALFMWRAHMPKSVALPALVVEVDVPLESETIKKV